MVRNKMLKWSAGLSLWISLATLLQAQGEKQTQEKKSTLPEVQKVLILGDSISQNGTYVAFLETRLLAETDRRYHLINLGLGSETVSGLSEVGHAGGKFPRPDLHERLDRALKMVKPELVLASYGMNDGIYLPYSDTRFGKFKSGMERLRSVVKAIQADLIHLTPTSFDPLPIKDRVLPAGLKAYPQPFEGYNRVLDRYSQWLLDQRKQGWKVMDLHFPMNQALEEKRKTEPKFTFAKDGVHPNDAGHWLMAQQILKYWNVPHDGDIGQFLEPQGKYHALHQLVSKRSKLLHAAYLSAVGHKRPGVAAGLPVAEAEKQAAELTVQIEKELLKLKEKKAVVPMVASQAAATPSKEASSVKKPALYPGKVSDWNGFDRYDMDWQGKALTVVAPKTAKAGKPWVWHGEFFGHKPNPDIALLKQGYHIVYLKINDMLGSPPAVAIWNDLYAHLTKEFKFGKKPALVGLSRGGLYCYNWAIANPEKVSCVYADAPVCDFKSWPGGTGKGKRSPENWERVLKLWGFKSEEEALAYKGNPVDALAPLAKAKVPLLHVFGDADEVVPIEENTLPLAEKYRELGGTILLIGKAGVGHHPHGLEDSSPIVNFIMENTK